METMKEKILCVIILHSVFAVVNSEADSFKPIVSREESLTSTKNSNVKKFEFTFSTDDLINLGYPILSSFYSSNRNARNDLLYLGKIFGQKRTDQSGNPMEATIANNETLREEFYSLINRIYQNITYENPLPEYYELSVKVETLAPGIKAKPSMPLIESWPLPPSTTVSSSNQDYFTPSDYENEYSNNEGFNYMKLKTSVVIREPKTNYNRIEFHEFAFHKVDFLKLGYSAVYSVLANGTIPFEVKQLNTNNLSLNMSDIIRNNGTLSKNLNEELESLRNQINEYINYNNENLQNYHAIEPSRTDFKAFSTREFNNLNFCAFELFKMHKVKVVVSDDPSILVRRSSNSLIREMKKDIQNIYRQILMGKIIPRDKKFRDFLINGGAFHANKPAENEDEDDIPFSTDSSDAKEIQSDEYSRLTLDSDDDDDDHIREANRFLFDNMYECLKTADTNFELLQKMRCHFNAIIREYQFRHQDYYYVATDGNFDEKRNDQVQTKFIQISFLKELSNDDYQTSFLKNLIQSAFVDHT